MTIEQKLDKKISLLFKPKAKTKAEERLRKGLTYSQFLSDKMLMISLIRNGVPYSLFDLIKSSAPFSEGDWAAFLDMSTKSLQRYKQGAKNFKPIHSEKIIEMAEVTNFGKDVFGDEGKFKLWLNTPSFALGGERPVDLLRDSYGKELVMGEIHRIAHGILV